MHQVLKIYENKNVYFLKDLHLMITCVRRNDQKKLVFFSDVIKEKRTFEQMIQSKFDKFTSFKSRRPILTIYIRISVNGIMQVIDR